MNDVRLLLVGVDVQQDSDAAGDFGGRNGDLGCTEEWHLRHSKPACRFGGIRRDEIRRCREDGRDDLVEFGDRIGTK